MGFGCLFVALGAVCYGFDKDSNTVLFNTVGYSLIAVIMACAVSFVWLRPEALLSKCLSLRPIVFLGEISYGLYLYQSIVIASTEKLFHISSYPVNPTFLHRAILLNIPVIILIAWLSFRIYELPIMKWGKRHAQALS